MDIVLIAFLMTCHNRKAKTLLCLNALYNSKTTTNFIFDVYLVDDGCTDGTVETVKENYSTVNIISGNGNLFWNRGMHWAWKEASETKNYDYYIWLNDDTTINENAIELLINYSESKNNNAIIGGACNSMRDGKLTYSGYNLNNKTQLEPNGTLQKCDVLHGNIVLIPNNVFNKLGNLDYKFHHAIGDFDYCLRAKKVGIACYLSKEYIASCELNSSLPKWCLKQTPILKRFKILYSPLGYAEPIPFFIYEKRHFGLNVAIKHFLSIHLRALIPQLWK